MSKEVILEKVINRFVGKRVAGGYVVSFPKSGRTWLRNILAWYVALKFGKDFSKVMAFPRGSVFFSKFPDLRFTHDVCDVPYQDKLSHQELEVFFKPEIYAGKKIALLVRDPRDVVVSFFYHKKYRERTTLGSSSFEGDLNKFVFDDVYGIKKIIAFMNIWAEYSRRTNEKIKLWRYEDLRSNALDQTVDFLGYFGEKADVACLEEALENSSVKRMIEREVKDLNIVNESQRKTRKAKVGGYVDELAPELIAKLDLYIKSHLDPMYESYKFVKETIDAH